MQNMPTFKSLVVGAKSESGFHLSVMAGYTPAGKVYTLIRAEAFTSEHTVLFLEHLRRQVGKRMLVIWDGSPIHRWGAVPEYLASGAAKTIHLE